MQRYQYSLVFLFLLCFNLFNASAAQLEIAFSKELKVYSTISKVTVYKSGAVLTRSGQISLEEGGVDIIFDELERGINRASVHLSLGKEVGIFSLSAIDAEKNTLKDSIDILVKLVKQLDWQVAFIEAEKAGLAEESSVLTANKTVQLNGENGVSVDFIREAANLYREKTIGIQKRFVELKQELEVLLLTRQKYQTRIDYLNSASQTIVGQVSARLIVESAGVYTYELSYLIDDAGWTSDYDLLVDAEGAFADMILVGSLYQNTGINWKNVALNLSTGNPNRQLMGEEVYPVYIGSALPPKHSIKWVEARIMQGAYEAEVRQFRGSIFDTNGEPLIGAVIHIEGTSYGTQTNLEGEYVLQVPEGYQNGCIINVSYTGYEPTRFRLKSTYVDVFLAEGLRIEEVVVVNGYSSKDAFYKPQSTPALPATFASEHSTLSTFTYQLKESIDLVSGSQPKAVRLQAHRLALDLQYTVAPRYQPTTYLQALVTGWDTLGLLNGNMRLHLDGKYVGTTEFISSQLSDTLKVPLGADDRIIAVRKALKQSSESKFFTAKAVYSLGYEISIRNSLSKPINIEIVDQIPVSQREDIQVEITQLSLNPSIDKSTGILTWQLDMPAMSTQRMLVMYEVKAPKEVEVNFE